MAVTVYIVLLPILGDGEHLDDLQRVAIYEVRTLVLLQDCCSFISHRDKDIHATSICSVLDRLR